MTDTREKYIHTFLTLLNNINDDINFILEIEGNKQFPFLNILVVKTVSADTQYTERRHTSWRVPNT